MHVQPDPASAMRVHRLAGALPRRAPRRSAPVVVVRVHPDAWTLALILASDGARRAVPVDERTALVVNR